MSTPPPSDETIRLAVDAFWETIPSCWHHVRAHIRQLAVEQFGITVEQFHILRHIRKGQGSVSELAEAKQISRAAISQAVELLVVKGLVLRTTDRQDRRHVQLDLTPAGDALLDAIFDDTRRWMAGAFAHLSAAELDDFQRGMRALQKVVFG
jgi:DNA-binding MarR family transcriptional regulator